MDNLAQETQLYWLQISVNKKPLWNFSCPRITRPFGCPLPGHHHHDLDLDLGRAGNTTYIYTIRPKQLVSLACGGGSCPIWLFSMTLQRSCLKQLGSFAFGEIEEKIRFWLNRCPASGQIVPAWSAAVLRPKAYILNHHVMILVTRALRGSSKDTNPPQKKFWDLQSCDRALKSKRRFLKLEPIVNFEASVKMSLWEPWLIRILRRNIGLSLGWMGWREEGIKTWTDRNAILTRVYNKAGSTVDVSALPRADDGRYRFWSLKKSDRPANENVKAMLFWRWALFVPWRQWGSFQNLIIGERAAAHLYSTFLHWRSVWRSLPLLSRTYIDKIGESDSKLFQHK